MTAARPQRARGSPVEGHRPRPVTRLCKNNVITLLIREKGWCNNIGITWKGMEMETSVRRIGNSQGFTVPKALLSQLGLSVGDHVELALDDGRLVIEPVKVSSVRAGWAEAAKDLAEHGDDKPVWPMFGNDGDDAL